MAGFSFSSSGATPKQGYLGGGSSAPSPFGFGGQSVSPFSKALTSAASSAPPPAPSTPVKKTTITGTDGSTHTTEYHAPEKAPTVSTPTSGLLTTGGKNISQTGGSPVPQGGEAGTPIQQPQTNTGMVNQGQGEQTTSSPTYPGLVGSLANIGQKGSAGYNAAVNNLAQFRRQVAGESANIAQQPIELGFQQGRQQVLSQKAAVEDAALQNAVNQQQVQQGQQITALTSATNSVKPEFNSSTLSYYSPLTAGAATTPYIVKSGDTFYALAGGDQNKIKAIEEANPGVNPANLQPGQQINLPPSGAGQYGSGPAAAANVQSIGDQQKIVNDWAASRQAATNIGNQLQQFLQQNNVNPTDFNAVNQFLQVIGKNTSSAAYKQFYNLVTDLANTYAPVLSADGNATNYKTELAQSLLDGTASGQTIPQILTSLDGQAQAKISGYQENIKRIQSGQNVNPTSSNSSTPPSSQGGSSAITIPGFPGGFSQDANGMWSYKS